MDGPLKKEGASDGAHMVPDYVSKRLTQGILGRLDRMDQRYSSYIHKMQGNRFIDSFILIFGLMFNRAFCIVPVVISGFQAKYHPEKIISLIRPGAIAKEDAINLYVLFIILEILALLALT